MASHIPTRYLIIVAILCAFTGYGQNQRAASYTATVALTNTGKHNQFASDGAIRLGSGATGVMLTNILPGATPLVAFRATDNADYASVLGLTLQAWTGGTRNFIADGPGNAVGLPSGGTFGFSGTTDAAGVKDVGLMRAAAGRMVVNNGAGTEPDGALDFGAGTAYGLLTIRNALAIPPTHILTLAVNQQTNAYQQIVTNAHFQVLFGGTPADGARGQFDIKNTAATNITVTWPISWSIAQAALITTFTAYSNSITEVFWAFESGSNRVRVASKEIVENFLNPSAGQAVVFHDENTKTNKTIAGSGDVTAAANFAVDNVVIRSDGTSKGVQASGVSIDDTGITSFGQGATAQGEIRLLEDTDNGANYVAITPTAALAGNTTITAPAVTGLMALHTTITNIVEFAFGETNVLATGTGLFKWRAPHAMTVVGLRASLSTASSSGIPTVDINEAGTTIISTKLTIDANETTSTTAAAAFVLSDSAIADDAEITFDIDVAGTGAAGLKVKIYYTR